MIKRMIEISSEPCHIYTRLGQLIIQPRDSDKDHSKTIPCEDIGVVLIDHPQATITQGALAALSQAGAPVVVAGSRHLPVGIMLPVSENTEVVWRVKEQIMLSEPARKRLWQQVVAEKVKNQARALPEDSPAKQYLLEIAKNVKTDDKGNDEGYAARIYWSQWLGTSPIASDIKSGQPIFFDQATSGGKPFTRDADSEDPLNFFLNYGYSILRAAVARALVCAGLYPVIALKHQNRSNAFALADDLMEPMRPMVDIRVRRVYRAGARTLDPRTKASLLSVLYDTVGFAETTGPLLVCLHRYTAAYIRCLQGKEKTLLFPKPLELGEGELSSPEVAFRSSKGEAAQPLGSSVS